MKKILNNLPILYGFFLLIGYVNMAAYYSNFGISILEYSEISEMLLSFLNVTAYLLGTIGTIFASQVIGLFIPDFPSSRQQYNSKQGRKAKMHKGKFIKFLFAEVLTVRNILIIIIVIFTILLIRRPTPLYKNWLLIWLLETLLALLTLFTIPFKIFDIRCILTGAIYLIVIISINKQIVFHQNISGYPEFTIEFKIGKIILKSDNDTIYVGMTRNYLFMYSLKQKRTNVYERSKITDLSISSPNPVRIEM